MSSPMLRPGEAPTQARKADPVLGKESAPRPGLDLWAAISTL
jgi:hypothetical protein